MQNKILNRMLGRTIKDTRGRFIAITLIIMLGVMIFVGVKGIGPGYRDTATSELTAAHLQDISVTSTAGLTSGDVARAKKVDGITVSASKSTFALASSDDSVVNVFGYRNNRGLNRLMVRDGHLPRKGNEIVLDARAKDYGGYRLGDTYRVKKTKNLKRRTYKIVGFADSPLFINDNYDRGNTNIGSGTVAYFAYVKQSNINMDVYTSLALRLNKRPAGDTYDASYKAAVAAKLKQVKKAFRGRASARRTELINTALKPVTKQQKELDAAKAKVALGEQSVIRATRGQVTTTPELTAQIAKITAAQEKVDAATQKVQRAISKPDYSYGKRADLVGFSDYGASADRIAAIGDVFPVFFFLIAALITFTTISRMISEDRTQLGTMKALGYSGLAIARNYFLYALLAAIIGIVFGVVIGQQGLVRFVLAISKTNIFTAQVVLPQWGDIALAALMSLLATIGAVAIVTPTELRTKPSELMLPKAPKNGKKILLERITPLWQHLSFNAKVSLRNLFRFKSRMFMTIIGIAGGAGLILTGFGIRDSILGTAPTQFGQVLHYQTIVRMAPDEKPAKALDILNDNRQFKQGQSATSDTVELQTPDDSLSSVSMIVPQHDTGFNKYVSLKTTAGKQISLPKRGMVVTEKAAQVLKLVKGDKVRVKDSNGHKEYVRVTAIVQNYTGHFIYLSKSAYKAAWGKNAPANSLLVQTKTMSKKAERRLARKLLKDGGAVNTTFMSDSLSTIDDMSKSLNAVVVILIVLSGMLSFVVLYNLTNINVSERMRELSTIKVLGFYDGEVTMYIVRENIALTLVGILCSFGVGQVLTRFILQQAATDTMLFPVIIGWGGYVAATVLTLLFTAIVMYVTHVRLKRGDMLEALAARE
ncbi:ABC transporter permease [Lacticaseibacillus hulanensis]|uniref:ABC transporter permease n=1 Tax=Lacticaseibacillus hulanensis TaxID=2493111 RepID=UPI0013E3594F|nr:ABC transporter permease [Lacticaseibacillus hulanensis]